MGADEKTMAVCASIAYEPSEERLPEEFRTCELVSANRHRMERYELRDANRESDKN